MTHPEKHPQAGMTVMVAAWNRYQSVTVEDWWDRMHDGRSWRDMPFNAAAANYARRVDRDRLPGDDEVFYAKLRGLGYLFHASEIKKAVASPVDGECSSGLLGSVVDENRQDEDDDDAE